MRKCGLGVVQQRRIVVFYDDVIVGEYTADLLVEDQVIVELKVVGALSDVHVPQCRNYLRATGKPLCLLINSAGRKSKSARHPLLRVLSPLTRVLARPSLVATTIHFIPAYPASSALKNLPPIPSRTSRNQEANSQAA
jgi:hypothetical protein